MRLSLRKIYAINWELYVSTFPIGRVGTIGGCMAFVIARS